MHLVYPWKSKTISKMFFYFKIWFRQCKTLSKTMVVWDSDHYIKLFLDFLGYAIDSRA